MKQISTKLTEYLDRSGVAYRVIHHPAAFTAQELAAIGHVQGRQHAKVVITRKDEELLMLVLPAERRIDWDRLQQLTGAKLRMATESEFAPVFPDCAPGAMPPFGCLYGVATWMDPSLGENEILAFAAGTHTDTIRLACADYLRLAKPQLVEFAVKHP